MYSSKVLSLLVFCVVFQNVYSARILAIIPIASYSHQMFYQEIWRGLALQGHDMVVVTTDPTGEQLPNFKEIDIKETYGPVKELIKALIDESAFMMYAGNRMMELLNKMVMFQMNLPQMQELIHNKTEHFDLVMVEHFTLIHLAFKHRFQCPMIGMMSTDGLPYAHEVMGNPSHGVLYPTPMLPFQDHMTFLQRTVVMVFRMVMDTMYFRNRDTLNAMAKEVFGEGVPDIIGLYEETDFLMVNANPLFSATRPHTPSTISIAGGIHIKKPKSLPKDLQEYLDTAPNGVIYFSLGSNVKSKELSLEMRQTLIGTLSQLPCKVLWKFEDDTLSGKPDNVRIIKWAPQQDILRHPNVRMFITQGGIQSLEEALYSHVPVLVMPFMGDQESNAERVRNKEIGIKVDPHTLTVEVFKAAILEVFNNPKYKENIKQLSTQIQDEPMTPLEKAIWWTEYVLRHKGAQHLKGPRIPMYQYFYLDIWAFLFIVFLVLVAVAIFICKLIMGLCSDRSQKLKQL